MKHVINIMALSLILCLSVMGGQSQTNVLTTQEVFSNKGIRIWIRSFAIGTSPILVNTEQCAWPVPNGTKGTPSIPADVCRQWRTNYSLFRQLLISAAEKARLDAASLAKVIPEMDFRQSPMRVALPVEAHSTQLNGELSWIVTYRWENVGFGPEPDQMMHIMARAFSQRTLKEVWGMQCD